MLSMLLCGWNEGSTGPLIPRLQEYYNINYLIMSLVYLTMFVGAMTGGLSNIWITDRIGFGLICPLGALSQSIAYMLMGTGGPYGLFLVAFVFNGFGLAVQDAQVNNLTTRLPHAHTKMSFVQACFGLGGMVSPFISTPFAAHVKEVYRYYFVAMGIGLIAMVIMLLAFDRRTEEQLVGKLDIAAIEGKKKEEPAVELEKHDAIQAGTVGEAGHAAEAVVAAADTPADPPVKVTSGEKMKRMLTTPTVYALMAWAFVYIGVEVAISGWLTTYLVRERGANANAGFAVTGFWGGMTVGRIVLIPFTNKVGYQFSIYFYSLVAIALEFVIWYTKSVVGNAVCFAFVGFFMGPVYPVALIKLSEILDDDIRGGVMGMMGSMGGAGAAAVPLITGAISDRFGIWTLQPIGVSMIGAYILLWMMVPRHKIGGKK
ncbi:hypothetical protein VHUM_04047 [Vanrija humicola]|uniref:Major facilitator superfamily (MFS) profile domain-containing protein n=1 Tax=Vanrija humicola TaxID=5417 RepID=A0A7D8YVS9_VANHU|nr:hypothetical protein VHUM_04047 [Vanrija humicola]